MESIRDSVSIANEFVTYICLIGAVFAAVLVWFISKRVTKPLSELTELSKRMAALDFDAKYTSGGNNEIGQLGKHFNQMSENLEKAYSDLLTANNELQKDIEKKQQVDEMRKEFLSNVSHELKTPIALIQGYAEGLQECVNDDEESRAFYCEVIMDEASKMNTLVQKLLTLNQLEFGNDQTTIERFDLVDLIRNKLQSVEILAQQKEARITYHGGDSVSVWGDEFKIEEILTNYLSNALNHIDGERRIEVTVRENSETVRVSVFNTGEPIPEEDIDRIWDKFYKVDKARTREYGGSGVGLSIVKAIMESHHQKYGVQNHEDGVEFWFELQSGSAPAQERKENE
jgi:signal transduction histidine kinase